MHCPNATCFIAGPKCTLLRPAAVGGGGRREVASPTRERLLVWWVYVADANTMRYGCRCALLLLEKSVGGKVASPTHEKLQAVTGARRRRKECASPTLWQRAGIPGYMGANAVSTWGGGHCAYAPPAQPP
jgi:hypothetical protein